LKNLTKEGFEPHEVGVFVRSEKEISRAEKALDNANIPYKLLDRIEGIADNADLEEVYGTERHLLYVACTRARDRLLITSGELSSEFLEDMSIPE
jgi:superfamily I DNA/RNA helicase